MSLMIQSYYNDIQKRYNSLIPQDTSKQDTFRTHVKAYRPRGHIIESSPFSIKSAIKNDADAVKYFCDGIKGYGNDYSIGRINDVAIKLSGLGIAGMLATSQGSPLKKGMEFVGLLCWLGAMSLWPKLAINTPIKHLKGVDLDMEYVTSRGHKKRFYNDPQFICWDMISDSDMDKMGDKLGIPRNIKNRRKAIENKARQVAVQGNTLALLTAGFATPLIASLAADQLGKHALYPLMMKTTNAQAEKLAKQLSLNINNLVFDKSAEAFIDKELPATISPKTMNGIKKMFMDMTEDTILHKNIKNTLDKIFGGKNIEKIEIPLDDKLLKKIISEYDKTNSFKVDIKSIIQELAEKYSGKLDGVSMKKFVSALGEKMILEGAISAEANPTVETTITKMLSAAKTYTLAAPETTVEQLRNLSKLILTYDSKVHKLFTNGFEKCVWNGAVSLCADTWQKMPEEIVKALDLDSKTLQQLSNSPSTDAAYGILSKSIDKIVGDKKLYDKVIQKLGKMATIQSKQTEKYLKLSLEYLDNMQRLLTSYDQTGEMAELTESLNVLFKQKRRNIIGKFASASNTTFLPIRIMSVLKEAHETADYETLKNILFRKQNVDAFMTRLDALGNYIKNEDDYKRIVEKIFGGLSPKTKAALPMGLGEKIDALTDFTKYLLVAQSDKVKAKYNLINIGAIQKSLQRLGLLEYIDDFYEVSIKGRGLVVQGIQERLQSNPDMADKIKRFLKLSDEQISNIKAGDGTALDAHLWGSPSIGSGFAESGKQRTKLILEFLGTNDFEKIGGIDIFRAKPIQASSMQPKSFINLVKDSSQNVFSYKRWLKRVGFAFVGLCAISAFAISQIGKRNEFNPDIYKERRI